MSKEIHTIELTDTELYILWSIVTWFERPLVTDKLKYKLAGMASSPDRDRLEKRFDDKIMDRIIELGRRLPDIREEMRKYS